MKINQEKLKTDRKLKNKDNREEFKMDCKITMDNKFKELSDKIELLAGDFDPVLFLQHVRFTF